MVPSCSTKMGGYLLEQDVKYASLGSKINLVLASVIIGLLYSDPGIEFAVHFDPLDSPILILASTAVDVSLETNSRLILMSLFA